MTKQRKFALIKRNLFVKDSIKLNSPQSDLKCANSTAPFHGTWRSQVHTLEPVAPLNLKTIANVFFRDEEASSQV